MNRTSDQTVVGYYQSVLLAIFVFMLKDKASRSSIREIVTRQLEVAQLLLDGQSAKKGAHSAIFAAALHEWYRNAAYLDRNAEPKALPLHGRKPSVAALVRLQKNSLGADQIAKEMLAQCLIKKASKGKYLPISRVATIRRLTPASIEHVSRSLERLLATVDFNTRGGARRCSLIERTAFVQDLPRQELPSFRAFAQEQGSAFLATADEWLESRRASKRASAHSDVVKAGIHVYAFEDIGNRRSRRQDAL